MNGRPRINEGFLVGHHEFYENERRRDRRLLKPLKRRKLVKPRQAVKDKRKASDE